MKIQIECLCLQNVVEEYSGPFRGLFQGFARAVHLTFPCGHSSLLTIKLMERSLFMHADYWLAQGW